MINIENMRAGPGGTKAIFDAGMGGWLIRDCIVVERPDGSLSALPPALRDGRRAVQVPDEIWFRFIKAALAAYRQMVAEGGGLPSTGRPASHSF